MSIEQEVTLIIDSIINNCKEFDCNYYESIIRQKSEETELGEDVRIILKRLSSIASYHFKHEDGVSPYGPLMQTVEGRTPIPEDLTEQDLESIRIVAPLLNLSVLRARVYDVLWLRLRVPEFAEEAISNFTACADKYFDLEQWTYCAEYAERALRIAVLFRRKKPELAQSVSNLLQRWIDKNSNKDERFLTARAIQLQLEFGYGDPGSHYSIAKSIAKRAEKAGDYHRAENYWKLAVSAARNANDDKKANSAQISLAETYVTNAKSIGGGISGAHWMQQAIEAYKVVPNSKERRDKLYAELLVFQKRSLEEMSNFETPIDISECVNQTIKTIEGKTFREAVFAFAFGITQVPNYNKLKQQAEELAQKYPLFHLFGVSHLDSEGKIIAKSPGNFGNSDGVSKHSLYKSAALNHQIAVVGCILPAADILKVEHPFSLAEFEALVSNNPFIEASQERIWAQGLYAGMKGDFEIALPLIVPLLENSIRHILKQSGVRVSTLNTHGIQEELRISALLNHEVALEIFGYDLIMDLKGLLLERTYANLRNIVSHGLGSTGTYFSTPAIYLWWLCFRLVITPYAKQLSHHVDSEI